MKAIARNLDVTCTPESPPMARVLGAPGKTGATDKDEEYWLTSDQYPREDHWRAS
jgi:hypothetical protein